MRFLVTYHKDKTRKGKIIRKNNVYEIGDWRSRWERKRDLERADPNKDHITRIFSRGTPKDYIVTEVHGVSPDNLYFKAVPIKSDSKSKKKKGSADIVAVRTDAKCKKCGNYFQTVKKSKHRSSKSLYHSKKKK